MRHGLVLLSSWIAETLRILAKALLLAGLVSIVCLILSAAFGASRILLAIPAIVFALALFAAPMASSLLRARRAYRVFSLPAATLSLYCFVWGAAIGGLFVGALRISQGMPVSLSNFAVSMWLAGIFCAATSFIPPAFQRGEGSTVRSGRPRERRG